MKRIGYSVVNVGERDIRLGWERFAARTQDSELAFISSNIVDKQTREQLFPPYDIVEVESPDGSRSKRIGVVGVVRFNPIFSKPGPSGAPMAIVHPVEPVRDAVAQLLAENVDMIVLLAAMHQADAGRLAREVPGIDFILGSYGGLFTDQPEKHGETVMIYAGNQGKRLGVARVFRGPTGDVSDVQSRLHMMNSRYPSEERMLEFVDQANGRADQAEAASGIRAAKPVPAIATVGRYTGNQVCASCHAEAFNHWTATSHAHALDTLDKDPKGAASECQSCHVTGHGEKGGFTGRETSPQFASVGCETCHGPGTQHAKVPTRGYGRVSVSSCVGCHTREHSPKFDYYTYLGKVRHQETVQGSR
jgi:hypothetical protein